MDMKCHPYDFGNRVREIRKERRLSQIAFYKELYPNSEKTEEAIKKWMHHLENGKHKALDLDFLLTMCHHYELSADYVLGIRDDYPNHDTKFVCEYTGLDKTAVIKLHTWNQAKNNGADLSNISSAYYADEEDEYWKKQQKQEGITFLKIINFLFKSGKRKSSKKTKKTESFTNLSVLNAIYMLCMSRPKEIRGFQKTDEDRYVSISGSDDSIIAIDASKDMILIDDRDIWHGVCPKELLEQQGKNLLMERVDSLIEQVKNGEE